MYAVPLNYEAYIRRKGLPMVVSADKTHPQGLFSPEIFGVTETERGRKAALIPLNCTVMRPLNLNALKRVNRKIVAAATTRCDVYIRDGVLDIVNDDYVQQPGDIVGESGPRFLYNNWDKLDKKQFEQKTGRYSNIKMKEAIGRMSKDQIFQNYVWVIPIGFREEDQDTIMVVNDINVLYSDIIRYANLLAQDIDSIDKNSIEILLQSKVLEYGEYLIDRYLGPKGVGRKQILSRNIDNSSRMVILPQKYKSQKLGRSKIRLGAVGLPYHHVISMFRDTVLKFSGDFIRALFAEGYFPEGTTEDLLIYYDVSYLTDIIDKQEDFYQRLQPFPAIKEDGTFQPLVMRFEVVDNDGNVETVEKPLCWMEFFYIVLNGYADITNTRYTLGTRYPVDSVLSTQFLKPVPLTLKEELLKSVRVMGFEFEDDFPFVDENVIQTSTDTKIFEQGARVDSAVTVGFNGRVALIYSNMYKKVC